MVEGRRGCGSGFQSWAATKLLGVGVVLVGEIAAEVGEGCMRVEAGCRQVVEGNMAAGAESMLARENMLAAEETEEAVAVAAVVEAMALGSSFGSSLELMDPELGMEVAACGVEASSSNSMSCLEVVGADVLVVAAAAAAEAVVVAVEVEVEAPAGDSKLPVPSSGASGAVLGLIPYSMPVLLRAWGS